MPEISIIMPIYNAESTLDRALKSVSDQSFSDYELLLCDDGSTDNSLNLCRQAAQQDTRVHVLALEHAGVSAARNAGLAQASGTYIAFMDSDDWADSDWLSSLLEHAQIDVLSVCGYTVRDLVGHGLYNTEHTESDYHDLSPLQFMGDIFSNSRMYQGYVWNKLFSRQLIEADKPLRFDEEIHYNEDRLFLFGYLRRCSRIYYSGISKYNYLHKEAPLTFHPKMLSELYAFQKMCDVLERHTLRPILFVAEKDRFRAAATLYCLAKECHAEDSLPFLAQEVLRYRFYSEQFSEYPQSVQKMMRWAVKDAVANLSSVHVSG